MIGISKNNRENYPRKSFRTQEKETRVKFNPGLSANRPSNNWALEKLHARAGRIVHELPWDTSAEDVLMRTGWDSLETMYKVGLTEFVFKCLKGYNVTEFKDLFLQRNSGRRRNENIILPRPETNFIRNSIRFRGAIAWNTLTNKEKRAKTLSCKI